MNKDQRCSTGTVQLLHEELQYYLGPAFTYFLQPFNLSWRLITSSVLFQGRCSSGSHSSEEAVGGGSHTGCHQTQTPVQSQVQGQACRALSSGVEMETALQEMEMQTHQLHMCSPHCSPGKKTIFICFT